MLGAIAGDIIGSVYESRPIKRTDFPLFHPRCRFTDDMVLTVALADSLMHGAPFVGLLKRYYRVYPHAGYGGSFHQWAQSEDSRPYNSWGNGSAGEERDWEAPAFAVDSFPGGLSKAPFRWNNVSG